MGPGEARDPHLPQRRAFGHEDETVPLRSAGERPPAGGQTGPQPGADGAGAGTSGGPEPFNMANLLMAQQKLLAGGGDSSEVPLSAIQRALDGGGGAAAGARAGPVPDSKARDSSQYGVKEYLDLLARRWAYLVLPLAVVPALAVAYSLARPGEYESRARLVNRQTIAGTRPGEDLFSNRAYISSSALRELADHRAVRVLAAEAIVEWANGVDDGLLGRLWAPEGRANAGPPAAEAAEASAGETGPRTEDGGVRTPTAQPPPALRPPSSVPPEAAPPAARAEDVQPPAAPLAPPPADPPKEPAVPGRPPPAEEPARSRGPSAPSPEVRAPLPQWGPWGDGGGGGRQDDAPDLVPSAVALGMGTYAADRSWTRADAEFAECEALLRSPRGALDLVTHGVQVFADKQNVDLELAAVHRYRVAAAAATDALAGAIVEYYGRLRAGGSGVALIEKQIARTEAELRRVKSDIVRLTREAAESATDAVGLPVELAGQYRLLKERYEELRNNGFRIEEAEERVERLREFADEAAAAPPEHLVQRLFDLEIEKASLAEKYTEKHPQMERVNLEIRTTREAMRGAGEMAKELGVTQASHHYYYSPAVQLRIDEAALAGLKARDERLKAAVDGLRRRIRDAANETRSLEFDDFRSQEAALQNVIVDLRIRRERAAIASQGDEEVAAGDLGIELEEVSPAGASASHVLVLAVVVGLVAGVLLALLAERLDESVRLPAEMRALTGLPTLQVIPYFKRRLTIRPEDASSGMANVFAVLRNHIRYSAPGAPEKSVLVTSAGPGEGKSLIAVNLALSFAQEGNRTCLIDADIQKGERHALEEAVKLSFEPQVGLSGYLMGTAEIEHVLVPSTELPNLFYVSSGGRSPNPPRSLRSDRMAALFARLEEEFDVVVVDAPPILPVVDAAIVSSYCRSVVQVVRYGRTRREDLEEGVRRLNHVGALVVGLVLNCAPSGSRGYGYDYKYRARAPSSSSRKA